MNKASVKFPARFLLPAIFLFFFTPNFFAERLPIKIYTSADGLGSSFVNHLMQDSRGFMWFATRDGLSRFDGSQFVTYRVGAENSPPTIGFVCETRNGDFWITTGSGVFRFQRDAIPPPNKQLNRARPTLHAELVTGARGSLFEDSKGNLWLGSNKLFRLEEQNGRTEFREFDLKLPPNPKRDLEFHGIVEAVDGSLWVNTTWGLARRLPDGRVIFYQTETEITEGNFQLMLDADGRVWAARAFEVFVLKPEPLESLTDATQVQTRPLKETYALEAETETEIRLPDAPGEILILRDGFFSQRRAKRLIQTADRRVWLAMESDLFEFDGRVFRRFGVEQGLPTWMGDLAEDAAGNLWIGGRNGLARLDRRGLISYGAADGLRGSEFPAVTEARDGTLYFAANDFQINRFDGRKFHAVRAGVAPNSGVLWTSRYVLLDSRNECWILTNEKLYRFAASDLQKPLATYTSADGLSANAMLQIFEDSSGAIWVSTDPLKAEKKGLARFIREENRFRSFSEADGWRPGLTVSSFAEDGRGNLWLGFLTGGAARFRDGRFTMFFDVLPEGSLITDLHADKNGRLWLATTIAGLLRVDDTGAENPRFEQLTVDNGLSSNNVRTIAEDNFGRIYAGTVRGVDRISPESGRVKHFSVADGLAADFVVDSRRDRNGDLWFATMGGLSRLVPLPDEKPPAPQIWIGGLSVAGLPQPISELGNSSVSISDLTDTQNNLQIDFFSLDFRAGEILRYQYKLEGSNNDQWSEPTGRRTTTYGNLSPGEYRFLVRAVNSEGLTSENPAVVSFRILPPVYARWWFIALVMLLMAVMLYSFYRYRTARLREVNRAQEELNRTRAERILELEKVRNRIATDLHDDIGASLTQIAVLAEVARQTSNGDSVNGAASEPLAKISAVSNELVEAMSDIVWSINPTKDHLSDLTQRMRRFAADVLSAKKINFQFAAPVLENDVSIGTNLRREVFLIFKEAVNNVAKHSGATSAKIEFLILAENLTLKISDNGTGFGSKPQPNETLDCQSIQNPQSAIRNLQSFGGNGLLSMRRRAREMNGEIEIASESGAGTQIVLRLPLETTAQAGGETKSQRA